MIGPSSQHMNTDRVSSMTLQQCVLRVVLYLQFHFQIFCLSYTNQITMPFGNFLTFCIMWCHSSPPSTQLQHSSSLWAAGCTDWSQWMPRVQLHTYVYTQKWESAFLWSAHMHADSKGTRIQPPCRLNGYRIAVFPSTIAYRQQWSLAALSGGTYIEYNDITFNNVHLRIFIILWQRGSS